MVEKKGDTQKKNSSPKKDTAKKTSSSPKKESSVKSHTKAGSTSTKKDTSTKSHAKKHSTPHKEHSKTHKEAAKKDSHKTNKKPIYVGVGIVSILVLFALGAVLFSVFNPTQGTSTQTNESMQTGVVATVNGEEISSQEVAEIQKQLSGQGQNLSQEEALNQAVITTLLKQKVEEQGYMMSQEEVEDSLSTQLQKQGMTLEQFKSQQGEAYQETLDNYKFQFGVQSYLEDALSNKTPEVSEQEIQQYYQLYSQQSQGEVQPLEQVREQLVQTIQQRKMGQVRNQFIQQLVENASVEYN